MKRLYIFLCTALLLSTANAQSSEQNVLLENVTGSWCTYCVDGYYVMDTISADASRVFYVNLHSGDLMEIDIYDSLHTFYGIGGFPNAIINREGTVLNRWFWSSVIHNALSYPSVVSVNFENVSFDTLSRALNVELSATFSGPEIGDFRFNCILVEDSVYQHDQVNYYNTVLGHPYYGAGDPIPNFPHPSVARSYLGGAWGTGGYFPNVVNSGTHASCQYSITVPANYNYRRLSLIGMLSTFDGTASDERRVLNVARHASVLQNVSANKPLAAVLSEISLFPNPSSGAFRVVAEEPFMLRIFDISGQLVKELRIETGSNSIDVSLESGLYLLNFVSEQKSITKKLMVNKQ